MSPGLPAAALLAISGWAFWRRFGAVLRTIRNSRPEPGFSWRPLAPRVRHFLTEVLLQSRVIGERPLPGLAHALVFWGFCVFALVTVNHLALGFGHPLFSRATGFGRFYYGVADLVAVAVAVSIAGLAARRFLARPVWLGPLSPESGLIAGLIFLLMLTHLATLWFPEGGAAGWANWWIHTLALLVFLPLLPHTKHLHLLLSPLTVFLKRPGFSRIPPLSGDEDFGLTAGKDLTQLVSLQAYTCVECGRCTEHCPARHTGKLLDPKQIVLGARACLNRNGAASEAPLLGEHLSMEAVFQCTTCGACEYQCPVGVQHLPLLVGLRRGAVNTGVWEDRRGAKLFLNLERGGNPMGFAPAEREKFIEKNALPFYDGSQEYCLWLGCMGAYDPRGRRIVLALVGLLRRFEISFGVLRKERCTGDAARRLGNDLLFEQLAGTNIEELRRAGATRLLSICPHCVWTMREDWKQFGADFAVEHHSELLARLASRLPAREGVERAVFHDPCYLARYRGVTNEPRQVLARWGRVVEPPRARERTFCCGAGGGLVFLGEEQGRRINAERAGELAATGAGVVAAACPFCQTMLGDGLAGLGAPAPRLADIAELAAECFPASPEFASGKEVLQ